MRQFLDKAVLLELWDKEKKVVASSQKQIQDTLHKCYIINQEGVSKLVQAKQSK
jgi:hypothetical protein